VIVLYDRIDTNLSLAERVTVYHDGKQVTEPSISQLNISGKYHRSIHILVIAIEDPGDYEVVIETAPTLEGPWMEATRRAFEARLTQPAAKNS
jgi:hypothetical protein